MAVFVEHPANDAVFAPYSISFDMRGCAQNVGDESAWMVGIAGGIHDMLRVGQRRSVKLRLLESASLFLILKQKEDDLGIPEMQTQPRTAPRAMAKG